MASGSIQRRLLAKPELTLQKAQNLAQALESADKNAKDLQGQRQPPMTAVNAVTCKRGPPRGTRAHTDTVCHSCKKRGHLARVCRSKRTQGTAAGRYGDGGKQPQPTHALESETSSSASEQQAYTLFPVNSQVSVDGVPMTMELDTGAAVSVISEHTYHSTWPHNRPALQPSLTKLRTYSGEELEVIGSISVQVCYEDQQEELPLLVVRGTAASLLGRNWLQKIRLDWQEIHQLQQIPALQETLKRYAEVFENELGEIKGREARIDVKLY